MRFIDKLLLLLFTYFMWSCVFVERHYCAEPLTDKSEGLLKIVYEYSQKYNPLFLARPVYMILFATFLFQINWLRGLGLFLIGLKTFAITFYYYFEFFGDIPVPDIPMFLAADGPYVVGVVLVIYRLLPNALPFPTTPAGRAPPKKTQ